MKETPEPQSAPPEDEREHRFWIVPTAFPVDAGRAIRPKMSLHAFERSPEDS